MFLVFLDAEMDMGPVLIIRSSSRTNSGPLEVLPVLEHSGTSKKKNTGTLATIAALHALRL